MLLGVVGWSSAVIGGVSPEARVPPVFDLGEVLRVEGLERRPVALAEQHRGARAVGDRGQAYGRMGIDRAGGVRLLDPEGNRVPWADEYRHDARVGRIARYHLPGPCRP